MKKVLLAIIILTTVSAPMVYGQRILAMEFRNRPIAEILMVLADSSGASIMIDETVSGQATFHFADSSFEDALRRFAEACRLHIQERDGVWHISRIAITSNEQGVSVSAEDTELEHLLRALSRTLEVTILHDPLPRMQLTVFTRDQPLQEVLEILIHRLPEYTVISENNAWFIRRQAASHAPALAGGRLSSSAIRRVGDLYSANIPRGTFFDILTLLFRVGEREFSLLNRTNSTLENLFFSGKTFEERSVRMRKTLGSNTAGYGLIICSFPRMVDGREQSVFLTVMINNNGQYAVGKVTGTVYHHLIHWTSSVHLNRGVGIWNTVRVVKDTENQNHYRLYINDAFERVFVDEELPFTDGVGRSGYIVVIAPDDLNRTAVEVWFDEHTP